MPIRRLILPIVVAAAVLTACGGVPAPQSSGSSPTTAPAATGGAPIGGTVPPAATAPATAPAPWSLVAVGDSIAFNSRDDCHGCTGFVDRYAAAISTATGHHPG